ncbi:chitinase-3-like protein 2 isoform X1 [Monomorium pharaonis]|uniref:chitinase-3-like protein 2 isoform X1 n=2 Tax=Monomorium pharaonis TaxID=307658 RepID=UPI00063F6BDC|nr:chitinase-3-like protein 2 isoform X1 [Monomorium pharaonis]
MVNQIPVPQAKYELLTNIRQPRWRTQVVCLTLSFVIVGVLFITRAWFGILLLKAPRTERFVEEHIDDAKIATWLRRARMYAESTKENQNADRNTSVSASEQFHHGATGQVLVCYYTIPGDLNTSWELSPSHIDPHLCTHIIVGFAGVVNNTLDIGDNARVYELVVALKNLEPNLKVMISAGGNSELHDGFSEMVKNHANRKKFIQSVLNVIKTFHLDGFDVDWEFPAWLGADDREKIHFVQLLQELRKEFDHSGQKLILTVAVAAPQAIVDQSYNIPEMAEHIDFVNLMSYDYHFYVWYFPVTDLNAPLFPRCTETGYLSTLNVNFSAQYWVAKGMPREKIVVGIPAYGHTYKLDNPLNHNLQAPASGFGKLGVKGFVSYPTVCQFLKSGGTSVFNKESRVPYAFKGREWISYDNEESIYYKSIWIRTNGFKGAMVLSLNVDDWNGTCHNINETFPLTRTVSKVLFKETDK